VTEECVERKQYHGRQILELITVIYTICLFQVGTMLLTDTVYLELHK